METRVLITGAGSYIGERVKTWLLEKCKNYKVDAVDTFNDNWLKADFTKYDIVFHVAGIAHVNAKKSMEPLYYKINRDLTIRIAEHAKKNGINQFIFMSSMIVFHESQSLKAETINRNTVPAPNGFYGDSKLQAEIGLHKLESPTFKVVILRPPMIYGPNAKGNFLRLVGLAQKTPIFPNLHNHRSMLYVDNLAEFVNQAILNNLEGTFYPQNAEYADTVEIVRYFANKKSHHILFGKFFNIFVYMFSPILQPLNKMFASYCYDQDLSKMPFNYQVVSLEESFDIIHKSLENK